MNNAVHIKNAVLGVLAFIGSATAELLGGWDMAVRVLVEFMILDYATGWLVAAVWHKSNKSDSGALSSKVGFKGLVKKCVIMALVMMAYQLDRVAGTDMVRNTVCLFFIANEGLSILENTAIMGVPYPAFIKNMLDAMKQAGDNGKTEAEDKEA